MDTSGEKAFMKPQTKMQEGLLENGLRRLGARMEAAQDRQEWRQTVGKAKTISVFTTSSLLKGFYRGDLHHMGLFW